jgi:hypothetical protein
MHALDFLLQRGYVQQLHQQVEAYEKMKIVFMGVY